MQNGGEHNVKRVPVCKTKDLFNPENKIILFIKNFRLVKQQETMQRFIAQPSLIPSTKVTNELPKNKPTDLTDALLQSNLNEMKLFSNTTSPAVTSNKTALPNNFSGLSLQPQLSSVTWNQGMNQTILQTNTWTQPTQPIMSPPFTGNKNNCH